ncbi:GIY-YIG nuclease family protein [Mesorhizobium sp. B2-2-4]|uniref:GIY-YIG nuclease family protein n=1 Tax=unclassified Mesorhizobium TaxID=325217 RepID=UPI0011292746|nr:MULTISPECIES: GIY-YIG nuclease family protein [unclassified Mesorhizobium]TPM53286.1 GIY-YIG nuclease family protein [Mesorhizobium sp. B2-2-4]TPM62070.1 GIY-YIG nuclease family protein [Mesorhizobium sp. B2-2-1]TPN68441.1 GIY-YIG nuclease family protein [Mesorhizobium sp. B1-1-3]
MTSYFEQRMAEINAEQEARRAAYIPPPIPKRQPPPAEHGHIYFMKAGNAVKIGRSANLRSRFKSLQTGSAEEARIVKVLPGGKRREKEFHKRFSEYRLRGEWFDLRGALAKYLEMCIHAIELPEPDPEPEIEIRL